MLLALSLLACAGPTRPAVAPATRALIEQAEQRERARRYDQARALYREAEASAPDPASRTWAARRFAHALLFWGEEAEAETELAALVARDPTDVASWHDLGIVRHRRGDRAGAERALRRAVALAPREPRPRIALAALLVVDRRWRDALAEYRALLDLDLPERTRRAVGRGIELVEAELRAAPRGRAILSP